MARVTDVNTVGAIILAAGQGRRMGADKALIDLGGRTAVERVVASCQAAGVDWVRIVRPAGSSPLAGALAELEVTVSGGEMLDSVRAGATQLPEGCVGAVVFPVDYAMVADQTVCAVVEAVCDGHDVVLPLENARPGHPIGLSRACLAEACGDIESLRDVVTADRGRVHAVQVSDPWVHQDLDTPADLQAARSALEHS
jgi:CTP:molybdopterin cytidylyltransferase MocA